MVVQFVVKQTGQHILVNVRPSSLSVTIDVATVYNLDAAGRLLGAYRQGRNYLRGLDNRVLVKWGAGHGLAQRSRCDLGEAEKVAFFAEIQEDLRRVAAALESPAGLVLDAAWSAGALPAIARVVRAARGYEALAADAQRFHAVYKPVSILPPDQYLALVLQATEGCSWNKCTFCDFYRDRPFHIKTDKEFRAHIAGAIDFLGPGLALRGSVFLADANALVIPQNRLLRLMDIVNAELPIAPRRLTGSDRLRWLHEHPGALKGIYSFVDAFTIRHKDSSDYAELAERNLQRVYIGLESGDDDLLRFLNKGSTAQDACQAVATIKAGGVDVGVIIMLGVGGRRFAAQHVQHSIGALNTMSLGAQDVVYFSPFFDGPGTAYGSLAAEQGIEPLTGAEMDAQMEAIRSALSFPDAARAPKIAVYDIREFIY